MTVQVEVIAGRELDALVAEKVMGWTSAWEGVSAWLVSHKDSPLWSELPAYSTDIAAAWQVVEHFIAEGWLWQLDIGDDRHWRATIDHPDGRVETRLDTTPTLAICRAALAAVTQARQ